MVSQIEDNAASLPAEPDFGKLAAQMDADGDFDDTTVAEDAPAPVADPVEESSPAETPVDEPQTSETEPEAEPAPVAESPQTEPPAPQPTKLTDIPEFREYQSKKDREFSELQAKMAQIETDRAQAAQAEQANKQAEDYLAAEVARGVASGYTEAEAEKLVRAPERVQQVRQAFQQQAENAALKQAIHTAGKQGYAERYKAQYNVSDEDMSTLLDTETPQAMERVAKALGNARESANGATAARRAAVPPETAETTPVGATSNAPAKPGFYELLDSAQDKEYSEMNTDERAAVDAVVSGRIPEN